MSSRHELPPLLPVQTSGLNIQPDEDISGMIVSLRDRVKKPENATIFHATSGFSDWLNKADNRRFWPLELQDKRPGEVLDTSDPLPLTEFGAIKGVLIGLPLGALSLALAWGIAKGVMGLISWILIGIKMLSSGAA